MEERGLSDIKVGESRGLSPGRVGVLEPARAPIYYFDSPPSKLILCGDKGAGKTAFRKHVFEAHKFNGDLEKLETTKNIEVVFYPKLTVFDIPGEVCRSDIFREEYKEINPDATLIFIDTTAVLDNTLDLEFLEEISKYVIKEMKTNYIYILTKIDKVSEEDLILVIEGFHSFSERLEIKPKFITYSPRTSNREEILEKMKLKDAVIMKINNDLETPRLIRKKENLVKKLSENKTVYAYTVTKEDMKRAKTITLNTRIRIVKRVNSGTLSEFSRKLIDGEPVFRLIKRLKLDKNKIKLYLAILERLGYIKIEKTSEI